MRVPDEEFYCIAKKEYETLYKLRGHKNIIQVHDIFFNKLQEKVYMVMDYLGEGSDLSKMVKNRINSENINKS